MQLYNFFPNADLWVTHTIQHRPSKQLLQDTYNGKHPRGMKTANKAKRRLKTIANIQLRELDRKMDEEQKKRYEQELSLYKRVVNQKKNDKKKI